MPTNIKPQLIVALDVDSKRKALGLVKKLYPKVKIFKVGLQLYISCGPEIIKDIRKIGAKVFLDLKFYDIPNTVKNAVAEASKLGVFMLTLHASGGEEMLKAASAARKKGLNLLGVTVLTSKKYKGCEKDTVKLAQLAQKSGLQGIVCSVLVAKILKKKLKKNILFVCPGVRPAGVSHGDQRQAATPQAAKQAGADYIVIGRPIIAAKNPPKAAKDISKEIN